MEENLGVSYLLLGFISSTFRSKLCAGRIVDGGKAILCIVGVSSGECDLGSGTRALRRRRDGGRCASSWDMGGMSCRADREENVPFLFSANRRVPRHSEHKLQSGIRQVLSALREGSRSVDGGGECPCVGCGCVPAEEACKCREALAVEPSPPSPQKSKKAPTMEDKITRSTIQQRHNMQ